MPMLPSRLEQLHRVAVGVFELDLLAAGTLLDLVPEAKAGLLHRLDSCRQVIHFEDDPVPPARLLLAAVGHRASAGTLRAAEPEGEVPVRDSGEGRRHREPLVQFEAQVLRVELDRLGHVLDLIPDRPGPELRLLGFVLVLGLSRYGRNFDRPTHRQQPDAKEYPNKPVCHGVPLDCELDRELADDRRPTARHSFCRWGKPWDWRQLTYPTNGMWLSRTSLLRWFTYATGLRPENSPKSRIRCDWSKNPQTTATAAQSGSVAFRTNSRARWNRRTRPYSFGVRPTSAVKS